jgi:hypothetical protein
MIPKGLQPSLVWKKLKGGAHQLAHPSPVPPKREEHSSVVMLNPYCVCVKPRASKCNHGGQSGHQWVDYNIIVKSVCTPTHPSTSTLHTMVDTFCISMSRQSVKSLEQLRSRDWRCSLALSNVYCFISDTFLIILLWLPGRKCKKPPELL